MRRCALSPLFLGILLIAVLLKDSLAHIEVDNVENKIQKDLFKLESDLNACRHRLIEMEDKLAIIEAHQSVLRSTQEEKADLVRKEVRVLEERLAMCETNSISLKISRSACHQDMDVLKAERDASRLREEEAEKALRLNDCAATRERLKEYRNVAEESIITIASLEKKIAQLVSQTSAIPTLQSQLKQAQDAIKVCDDSKLRLEMDSRNEMIKMQAEKTAVQAEQEAVKRALDAELHATKKALNSLVESLDTRQKYETLLIEHQREWLPHYMQENINAAVTKAVSIVLTFYQPASSTYTKILSLSSKLLHHHVSPVVMHVNHAFSSRIPGWDQFSTAVIRTASYIQNTASQALKTLNYHMKKAEKAFEDIILAHMQSIDALKSIARRDVVHFGLWSAQAAVLIPIAYTLLSWVIRSLIYMIRPGSAHIEFDSNLDVVRIETMLQYTFSHPDQYLYIAFDRGSPSHKNLVRLGSSILHSLVAENSILNQQQEEEKTNDVELRMLRALDVFIKPGSGARSKTVAVSKQKELYNAVIGAVVLDCGGNLQTLRRILFDQSEAPTLTEQTRNKDDNYYNGDNGDTREVGKEQEDDQEIQGRDDDDDKVADDKDDEEEVEDDNDD